MTKWYHEVGLDWMRERQKYLTASEIKQLLPVTKTGRSRTVTDFDRIKVYADKCKTLDADDCVSTGAAARGHVLEPYAIEAYNQWLVDSGVVEWPTLAHWDDCLVYRNDYPAAFSPDALNIEQFCPLRCEQGPGITWLGEVKCYDAGSHMQHIYTDQKDLEERWQIATAMTVCPTIEDAALIFYNPKLDPKWQLGIKHYMRSDLYDEIKTVEEVVSEWRLFVEKMLRVPVLPSGYLCEQKIPKTEEGIVSKIIEEWDSLSPEECPCR